MSLNTINLCVTDPLMLQLQRIFTTCYLLVNQCSSEQHIAGWLSKSTLHINDLTVQSPVRRRRTHIINGVVRTPPSVDTCCALVVVFIAYVRFDCLRSKSEI